MKNTCHLDAIFCNFEPGGQFFGIKLLVINFSIRLSQFFISKTPTVYKLKFFRKEKLGKAGISFLKFGGHPFPAMLLLRFVAI